MVHEDRPFEESHGLGMISMQVCVPWGHAIQGDGWSTKNVGQQRQYNDDNGS